MIWLLLSVLALAEPPASPGKLTSSTVDAHLDQLIPIIEEVTGRTFTERPEVVMANPGATRQVLLDEVEFLAKRMYPGLSDEAAKSMAFWLAESELRFLLGKYGLDTGKVYIRPKAIRETLLGLGVERKMHTDALRLVLAHELAHALQAQTAATSENFRGVRTWDAFKAFGAATEGHAVAVERAVADKLGLSDVSEALSDALGASYMLGYDFMAHETDAPEKNWERIDKPPERTGQIFHPETYNDGKGIILVGDAPYMGLMAGLGVGAWPGLSRDVGEWQLHSELLPISWDDRQKLAVGVQGGRVWEGQDNGRGVSARMWVMDSAESADAVIVAAGQNKAKIASRNPWDNMSSITVVPNLKRPGDVPGLDLEHTRWIVDYQQTYGDTFRLTTLWASDGPLVFQVEYYGFIPSDDEVAAGVRAAFGL